MGPSTTRSIDATPASSDARAEGWRRSPIVFLAAMAVCGLGLASAGTTLVRVASGVGLFSPPNRPEAADNAMRPPVVPQSAPEPALAAAAAPADVPLPGTAVSPGAITSSIPLPSEAARRPDAPAASLDEAPDGGAFRLPADAASPERVTERPQTAQPAPRRGDPTKRASIDRPDAAPRPTRRESVQPESRREPRADRPAGREPARQASRGERPAASGRSDGGRFERESGMLRIAPPAGSASTVRAYTPSPPDGRTESSGARVVTLGFGNVR